MNRPFRFSALAALLFLPLAAPAETFFSPWQQYYNPTATTSQFARATALDSHGNVFVTATNITSSGKQYYTAKYDALDGHILWQVTEGTGSGEFTPAAIAVDAFGDCVVTGSRNLAGSIDYYTVKYHGENGAPYWNNPLTYNGTGDGADDALKVATTSTGDVIVTGKSTGDNGNNSTGFDIVTIRYSRNGAQIGNVDRYTATQGNQDDYPGALAVDSQGNAIVAGTARLGSSLLQLYVRKLGTNNSVVWSITPINTGNENGATGVAVDSQDDVVVTGTYFDGVSHFGYYTAKLDGGTGSIDWKTGTASPVSAGTFGTPRPVPAGVAIGPDDQPIVSGFLLDSSNTQFIRTIKYTSAGSGGNAVVVWTNDEIGLGNGDTAAHFLTADASSNAILMGETKGDTTTSDLLIAKYDATTGLRTFGSTFNGTFSSSDDKGVAVATDALGNIIALGDASFNKGTGIGLRTLAAFKFTPFIAYTADSLPDGTPGVASAATYTIGNPPALSDVGSVVTKATVAVGRARSTVILAQGPAGGTTFPAVQNQFAPDAAGAASTTKYALFSDPVIAPGGAIAFGARTTGPKTLANGVWSDLSGTLKRVLRQGDPIAGLTPAANLAAVMSYSIADGQLFALAKLSGAAPMNTALLHVSAAGAVTPLIRAGVTEFTPVGSATGYTVKTITSLVPDPASPGDGRWAQGNAIVAKVVAVQTSDKRNPREVLIRASLTGGVVSLFPFLSTTQAATGIDATATYKTFGLPSMGRAGSKFAFSATLNPKAGSITAANDSALVYSNLGIAFQSFAREGVATGIAGIDTLPYLAFTDPIVNENDNVAFIATLKGVAGIPVNATNNRALIFGPATGTLRKVARLGDTAPAPAPIGGATAEAATRYSALLSFALSGGDHGAPIFLAKLAGGANARNNLALFAVGSDGVTVRRLLRTGESLDGLIIKSITLLNPTAQAFGSRRSFNSDDAVVVSLVFTNGRTALLRVGIP